MKYFLCKNELFGLLKFKIKKKKQKTTTKRHKKWLSKMVKEFNKLLK